jgi:hypothetical protein
MIPAMPEILDLAKGVGEQKDTYQQIHTPKAKKTFPDRRATSSSPQGVYFLQTSPMEAPSAVEHNRRSQEKQAPLDARRISHPHRFREKNSGRVFWRY